MTTSKVFSWDPWTVKLKSLALHLHCYQELLKPAGCNCYPGESCLESLSRDSERLEGALPHFLWCFYPALGTPVPPVLPTLLHGMLFYFFPWFLFPFEGTLSPPLLLLFMHSTMIMQMKQWLPLNIIQTIPSFTLLTSLKSSSSHFPPLQIRVLLLSDKTFSQTQSEIPETLVLTGDNTVKTDQQRNVRYWNLNY